MSPFSANNPLRELMIRHLEGEATSDEARDLEAALRESAEARREFAELLVQMVQLSAIGQEQKVSFDLNDDQSSTAEDRRWFQRGAVQLAAAACLFLLGVVTWFATGGFGSNSGIVAFDGVPDATATTNGLVVLTRAAGVVWSADVNSDVDIGVSLSPGRVRLSEGVVQMRFRNGAEVILEGPAEFMIISEQETALRFGRLSALVPEQAHGFKVYSGESQIVDLGTEFGMNRPLRGNSLEVHVFSGRVQYGPASDQRKAAELNEGQAVLFDDRRTRSMAASRAGFVNEEQLRQREFTELHERYRTWKKASAALAADPDTLIHLNFETRPDDPRKVQNLAQPTRASGGIVQGAEWTHGRWPYKQALAFNNPGDKIDFTVPGRHRSLTYLAWLRVESVPNFFNALSVSEKRFPGAVHLQLVSPGRVEFSVKVNGTGPDNIQNGFDRLLTRPLLGAEQLGRWIHLAAVYDGPAQTMSVYLNGQLVQWKKTARQTDLIVGDMQIGNWNPMEWVSSSSKVGRLYPSHYWIRDFRGQIDEFTILARPMSSKEIEFQYRSGKPSSSTNPGRITAQEGTDPLLIRENVLPGNAQS